VEECAAEEDAASASAVSCTGIVKVAVELVRKQTMPERHQRHGGSNDGGGRPNAVVHCRRAMCAAAVPFSQREPCMTPRSGFLALEKAVIDASFAHIFSSSSKVAAVNALCEAASGSCALLAVHDHSARRLRVASRATPAGSQAGTSARTFRARGALTVGTSCAGISFRTICGFVGSKQTMHAVF
jgi:hypothetical protein